MIKAYKQLTAAACALLQKAGTWQPCQPSALRRLSSLNGMCCNHLPFHFIAITQHGCVHWQVTGVTVYVGARYGGWQEAVLRYLATRFDAAARCFPADTTGAVRCLHPACIPALSRCMLPILAGHRAGGPGCNANLDAH